MPSSYLYKMVLCIRFLRNPPFLRTLSTAAEAASPPPPTLSFTVKFLTGSCGLPLDKALSAARTVHLDNETRQQPESVLALLRSQGFSDAHIAVLIAKWPRFLRSRAEANLLPKLQFLSQMGISGRDLPDLVLLNPNILRRSLDQHLKPSFEFFRCFVGSTENVLSVIRRNRWFLTFNLRATVMPNVALLVDTGVPMSSVSKLITTHPRAVMLKHDRFAEIVHAVKRLGIRPEQCLFAHAVRAMAGMSKASYAAKIELFRSLGWSEEELLSAFRRLPLCMLVSEEKMRSVSSFARRVGLRPSDLSAEPKLLMYGLEKRILPRFAVLQYLRSKGLRQAKSGTRSLVSMFVTTEKMFLERYVTRYIDRFPEIMDVYVGKIKIKVEGIDSDFGEQQKSCTGIVSKSDSNCRNFGS